MVAIDQEVDVTDPAALLAAVTDAAPDAIYHLAALTHVGQSWDEPLRVLQVNVIGTAALLAAARECGTDPADPGDQLGRGLRRRHRPGPPAARPRTSPTAPLTPYAASKLAAEALVAQASWATGSR